MILPWKACKKGPGLEIQERGGVLLGRPIRTRTGVQDGVKPSPLIRPFFSAGIG